MRICFLIISLLLCVITPAWGNDDISNDNEAQSDRLFFANQELLDPIFQKLDQLQHSKAWKVNIVHIGDSHVQADFLTNVIRASLQAEFGDGGYGFTFPYSLMRTNGTNIVKYTSNATWTGRLNVSPVSKAVDIGLSGIGLYTNNSNFMLQLNANKEQAFNSIKILYSTKEAQYNVSLTNNPVTTIVEEEVAGANQITHRIKRGENLSVIAVRYKTTVRALKVENNLRSDNIQAGRTLNIPSSANIQQQAVKKVLRKNVDYVDLQNYPYYSSYISAEPLNRISLFAKGGNYHDINGFVLENDKPGLIYHSIGVNGAKISDFNKYPLFYEQLNVLQPDLVILSFGTNESYQKLSTDQFLEKIDEMIAEIKEENPHAIVLVMTPPPSMIRRRNSNLLVKEYSEALMASKQYPIWDLYERMEGEEGIIGRGKYANVIAGDKIHYTLSGYDIQGEMFSQDFLKAYKEYRRRKEN